MIRRSPAVYKRNGAKSAAVCMAKRFVDLLAQGLTLDRSVSRRNKKLKRVKL